MGPEASWDEALARLEDVLLALPFDRALPDLPTILERAEVSRAYLLADERATKVLHEAIVARPLSSPEMVTNLKLEVELLTLEVEVLTQRLEDPGADAGEIRRATARLASVRHRLDELRALL